MTKQPCIVDCNRITHIGKVAETFLILIWGEGLYHLGLAHCRVPYGILTNGFGAGKLRFNSTLSDQFACHQSYTTFKFLFCGRGSLSVVFQHTTSYFSTRFYYIRHINFYSIQLYINITTSLSQANIIPRIVTPVFLNQFYKKSTSSSTQAKQSQQYYHQISSRINTTSFLKKEKFRI